jgi:DNA polymerase (family 10)
MRAPPRAWGTLTEPLAEVIHEERLREVPGVGEAIADIITRLHDTGTHPGLEVMRKEIPAGVLEMLTVPGLRPEKVMMLYKELGITSLAALEEAAKADRTPCRRRFWKASPLAGRAKGGGICIAPQSCWKAPSSGCGNPIPISSG